MVGTCSFELIVKKFTVDIIDIDGESPRVVKEGDCQTMSVSKCGDQQFQWATSSAFEKNINCENLNLQAKICSKIDIHQVKVVNSDFDLSFGDFVWTYGQIGKEIDFDSDKYTKKNGGKTIEVHVHSKILDSKITKLARPGTGTDYECAQEKL